MKRLMQVLATLKAEGLSLVIATQDPRLRANFQGAADNVVNFMLFVARQFRAIMAQLGFRTVNEMVGRCDRLEMRKAIQAGEGTTLIDGAHQLKSASAQVGALAAGFQAGEIERLARAQQRDAAANLLDSLEESVELACKIFEDRLRARAA